MPNKLYYLRRDALGKTLVDIHNETGLAASYIGAIERSAKLPELSEVDALAAAYGLESMAFAEIVGKASEVVAHIVTDGKQKYIICSDCDLTDPDDAQNIIRMKWENDKTLSRVCHKCGKDIEKVAESHR